VRLIERQCEELAIALTAKLRQSERTSEFQKIPVEELQKTAAELYHSLAMWLVTKTEKDVERHFVAIARRCAGDGISLQQFVWALAISRSHLHRFLLGQAFVDSIFELNSELELHQLLNQFFERATYYGVVGYEEARERGRVKSAATRVHRQGTQQASDAIK